METSIRVSSLRQRVSNLLWRQLGACAGLLALTLAACGDVDVEAARYEAGEEVVSIIPATKCGMHPPATEPSDTVARFSFEEEASGVAGGSTLLNDVGHGHARIEGSGLAYVDGPEGCSRALYFPEGNAGYVVIPNHGFDELHVGAIDFWIRAVAPPKAGWTVLASLSKDRKVGEFALELEWNSVRSTVYAPGMTSRIHTRFNQKGWRHVGLNFGENGVELWIDGDFVKRHAVLWSPLGNSMPWVLGSSPHLSRDGELRVFGRMRDVAIDGLRVSRIPRDFSKEVLR